MFIIAALGFTAAFLWRDVIMMWIEPLIIGKQDPVSFTIVVIALTVALALAVYIFTKLLGSKK